MTPPPELLHDMGPHETTTRTVRMPGGPHAIWPDQQIPDRDHVLTETVRRCRRCGWSYVVGSSYIEPPCKVTPPEPSAREKAIDLLVRYIRGEVSVRPSGSVRLPLDEEVAYVLREAGLVAVDPALVAAAKGAERLATSREYSRQVSAETWEQAQADYITARLAIADAVIGQVGR
jgi:hypothetical protein